MNPSIEISPNLMLAADQYNRYPGELVRLYLHFVAPSQPLVSLQLVMPRVMQAETYQLPPEVPPTLPSIIENGQDLIIRIPLDGYFTAGNTYNLEIGVRLNTFHANQYLEVESQLVLADAEILDTATLRLTVFGKGKYLQFLPEIYESDEFTSRFLMLFESFWKPINQQIDQIDNYFDPTLTPPQFVPWLASWMGMPVDSSLPLDRVRALLKNALMLFQCRGTPKALKTYLEIYTAGTVSIVERRARNLVLGQQSMLGMEFALGQNNQPNTVDIRLSVSSTELDRTKYPAEIYRRKIIELARALLPAHVLFNVECEFVSEQS